MRFLVWKLSGLLIENQFLEWCGRNSIVIYIWQFVLTGFMKNIVESLANLFLPDVQPLICTLLVFVICVVCVIPIVFLSNRFIPEIYGKKRQLGLEKQK